MIEEFHSYDFEGIKIVKIDYIAVIMGKILRIEKNNV